ncbi:ABC transporter ATP-binding protein [Halopiger goleimassiliensis]|uniref:ABC transporter ATP-binding protein n=1 Tax=Halopiger goleimassiliensis TaxID=1293048 RepID=UPI00067818F4|nr:ABC transporter ATP-binding protein [Halopiger goleimassiliensis]
MAAIELEGLTKEYGEVLATDGVTFTVEEGEIFGYLGPNGAGKTTTIRTLLGFVSPTAGTARIFGRDVTDERQLIEAKRRLGYLPDNPAFDEGVTGRQVLELHASIKGDERSAELLELFDPPLDRPVRDYSHGNVRKLGLVTTFMHDPDLVILDEPTGGLDPLMKQRFASFLRDERERGLTVFFSSHVLGEVRRLCDRVGIIRNGRLVAVEPVESLLHRSGKLVRLRALGDHPPATFDGEGVHDLEVTVHDDGTGDADAVTEVTFTHTGDVNAVLERLRGLELLDCTIEEAPLEDVFLRFYGDDEPVPGEDDASATRAGSPGEAADGGETDV